MILVGELSLWLALLMAVWSATVSFAGGAGRRHDLIQSGERAAYAAFAFTLLASVGLWTALLTRDFSLSYVASQIAANTPDVYVLAAFWSGPAGSMLLWCLVLALCATIVVWANRATHREMMPFVTGTLGVVMVFFLAATAFTSNPFARLDWIPLDGRGMYPQLQHPGMLVHPPALYLGHVATTVPFAFAIGALTTRRLNATWLATMRRWVLVSWSFLTIGIVLGMWWSYVEPGRGGSGYWAWEPAQNASLLPWLTGVAFLHAVMIQERHGVLRPWSVTLAIVTFLLSILGAFLARSAVGESAHAFAGSSMAGWFAAFFAVTAAAGASLVSTRLRDLEAVQGLERNVSRTGEGALLCNNLVLIGIAASVLTGTLLPMLSEWVRGSPIPVGPAFFNAVTVPLGLLLLALLGIGPMIARREASLLTLRRQLVAPVASGIVLASVLFALGMRNGYALVAYLLTAFVLAAIAQELVTGARAWRAMHGDPIAMAVLRLVLHNRRRYGGLVVHAGIALLFAAFAGLPFRAAFDVRLTAGQAWETADPYGARWRFVSQGVSTSASLNREITAVALEAWRDGKPMGLIKSEKRQYVDGQRRPIFEPRTEAGIRTDARQDVYVVLAGIRADAAEMRIHFNPLVVWVWVGGGVLALGALIVMWPMADRRAEPANAIPEELARRDPAIRWGGGGGDA
ncbi:MAG: cytochrome c-type biogenesis CcmF C-terminal domain-containing protein [Gemmatimonadaceae bacterium]